MQFRYSPVIPILFASVFSPSSSLLPASSPSLDASVPTVQDQKQLAREHTLQRLSVWQERLDLQDWKVSVVFSRADQLRPGSLADFEWDRDSKTATIRMLDSSEYRLSYADALKDMEFSVLHGLIHLELSSLPRNKRTTKREDFAISQLADALLRLDRPRP